MNWPTPLDGDTALHRWLNRLLVAAKASQPLTTADVKVGRGPEGAQLKVNFPPTPNPPAAFHPFKIYQFPARLRKFHNADDARRIKVRGGMVNYLTALGTDYVFSGNLDADPYNPNDFGIGTSQVLPTDASAVVPGVGGYDALGWNEFIVPDDGNNYEVWFTWVDSEAEPATGNQHGIMVGTYDLDAGSYANAVSLATGSVVATTCYQGFTDPLNIRIGVVAIESGKLRILQELVAPPLLWTHRPPYADVAAGNLPVIQFERGAYDASANYFCGDAVTVSDSGWLYHFIYNPPLLGGTAGSTSAYHPFNLRGALVGVDPLTNNPDPWVMLSKSPTNADYHTDVTYQFAKSYLRTA
jgi:hypothetical protein